MKDMGKKLPFCAGCMQANKAETGHFYCFLQIIHFSLFSVDIIGL